MEPLPTTTPTDRRAELATAFGGLLGAGLMFAGDLLLYGHLGSGAGFAERHLEVIAGASTQRLQLGGAVALLGALGYLVGALHVRQRLAPARPLLRQTTFLAFVATFVMAGAIHAVWGGHALVLRAAQSGHADAVLRADSAAYLALVYRCAEIVGYPASVLLIVLVLLGKSTWPRWTALLSPGVLMLSAPLYVHLPAPFGATVVGGTFNLAFVVFFLLSLLTLPRASGSSGSPAESAR